MKTKIAALMCLLVLFVALLLPKPVSATEPGGGEGGANKEVRLYEANVTCPSGSIIKIEGKCCEPGVGTCAYTTCPFNPPAVNCGGGQH